MEENNECVIKRERNIKKILETLESEKKSLRDFEEISRVLGEGDEDKNILNIIKEKEKHVKELEYLLKLESAETCNIKDVKAKETLERILESEKTNENLTSFFSSLLDLGVDNCFKEELGEAFRSDLKNLELNSINHQDLVSKFINKYK
ncbi:MAG: hypothetical protein PHY30_02070 [Candidatus Pacebacteria bacterium]|nr:hypothetical protein [Candidatus Paceibacterota bacterium]